MLIRITKCSFPNTWYKDEVGSTYFVCEVHDTFYKLKEYEMDKQYIGYISKKDCEIIKGSEEDVAKINTKPVLIVSCKTCGIELDKDKPWIDVCNDCLNKE